MMNNFEKLFVIPKASLAAASSYALWLWKLATNGFSKTDQSDVQDKARFGNFMGWFGANAASKSQNMDQSWLLYDGSYHRTKDLISSWVEDNSQLAGKFYNFLLWLTLFFGIGVGIGSIYLIRFLVSVL